MNKWITGTIILLMISSMASGRPQGEITVWCMGEEGNHIRHLARDFEKLHPGTKIITQGIPWDGAHDKLITSVAGNISPDVTQLGTTWVPEFAAMDVLMNLEGLLENSTTINKSDFFESSLATGDWHNTLYALPWYVDVRVVFYRSDILAKAGWDNYPETWQDLVKMAEQVTVDKDGDGSIDQYAINFSYRDEQHFLPFIWQAGGDILNKNCDKVIFDSEETREGLSFYKSLFTRNFNPGASNSQVDPFVAFSEGYYVSWLTGPWMVGECQRRLPPEMEGRWKIAMLPGKKSRSSYLGGCDLAIFKESRNPELAWAFVEYLSLPEVQLKWNKITGNLPAVRKTWEYPQIANDPFLKVFHNQIEDSKSVPAIECLEAMAEVIKNEAENLVVGNVGADQVSARIQKGLEEVLSRRRSSLGNIQKYALPLILTFSIFLFISLGLIAWSQRKHFASWPKWRTPIIFLIPIFLHLAIFVFIPIIASLFLSFTDYDIYSIGDWRKTSIVGLRNYSKLLTDSLFWKSMFNTGYFIGIGGPLTIFVALGAALMLDHPRFPLRGFFRTGYFLPVVIPLVAIAVVWRWIYSPQHGLLNWIISLFGIQEKEWLSDPHLAMPCLIAMAVWKNFGYSMVIFLAGLQAIPKTVREAASIDGADSISTFRYIILPMLRPTLILVMIMTTIGYMQFFAEPYVMTNLGGPQNRNTIGCSLFI